MKIHIWFLWPSIGDPNGVSIGNVWIPFKKSFFGGSIAATRPKRPENNVETSRKHPSVVGTRPGAPIMEISGSQVLRFGGSANNLVQYCSLERCPKRLKTLTYDSFWHGSWPVTCRVKDYDDNEQKCDFKMSDDSDD